MCHMLTQPEQSMLFQKAISVSSSWVRGATVRLAPQQVQKISAVSDLVLPKKSIFREFVHWQIWEQNSNFIVFFEGLPGIGKSWSSVGVGERLSIDNHRHFSIRYNVKHSIKEFVAVIADLQERFEKGENTRGTVLILDDAGVSANAQKWFEDVSKLLSDTTEIFRYLGLIVIITTPFSEEVLKRVRCLAHARFKLKKKKVGKYVLAKFYLHDHHWKDNKLILTKLRARFGGWNFVIDKIRIPPPSLRLRREYEAWMRDFKGGIIRKNNAILNKNIVPIEQRKPLSERQKQVYFLYRAGNSIRAIATQLGIGEGGVQTHLRSIRQRGWDI